MSCARVVQLVPCAVKSLTRGIANADGGLNTSISIILLGGGCSGEDRVDYVLLQNRFRGGFPPEPP